MDARRRPCAIITHHRTRDPVAQPPAGARSDPCTRSSQTDDASIGCAQRAIRAVVQWHKRYLRCLDGWTRTCQGALGKRSKRACAVLVRVRI